MEDNFGTFERILWIYDGIVSVTYWHNLNTTFRVGEGFWKRRGEAPSAMKWEDRIIEIREGSWSYVADSIGKAPGM